MLLLSKIKISHLPCLSGCNIWQLDLFVLSLAFNDKEYNLQFYPRCRNFARQPGHS